MVKSYALRVDLEHSASSSTHFLLPLDPITVNNNDIRHSLSAQIHQMLLDDRNDQNGDFLGELSIGNPRSDHRLFKIKKHCNERAETARFGTGPFETMNIQISKNNHSQDLGVGEAASKATLRLFRVNIASIGGAALGTFSPLSCSQFEDETVFSYKLDPSKYLLIPSIPCTITSMDLIRIMNLQEDGCKACKFIKDGASNRYMAILRFDNAQAAKDFCKTRDGAPFSWTEAFTCHLLPLSLLQLSLRAQLDLSNQDTVVSLLHESCSLDPAAELPTCPVCLERLDPSASGIQQSICRHNGHCDCLIKWQTRKCPVCRQCLIGEESLQRVQDMQLTENVETKEEAEKENTRTGSPTPLPRCSSCQAIENCWLCLLCGHCGCGRYKQGHARLHAQAWQHSFALEIASQRVWDYSRDSYVHRLVKSESGPGLIPIPGPQTEEDSPLNSPSIQSTSLNYYQALIETHLTSQQEHFNAQLKDVRIRHLTELEKLERDLKLSKEHVQALLVKLKQRDTECEHLKTRLGEQGSLVSSLKSQLEEEQVTSNRLSSNIDILTGMLSDKDTLIISLEEQISDLAANLEAQLALIPPDVTQGTITVKSEDKAFSSKKGIKNRRR